MSTGRTVPEDKHLVPLPDALLDQVEEEQHLGRVLQQPGNVVGHQLLRLREIKQAHNDYFVPQLHISYLIESVFT